MTLIKALAAALLLCSLPSIGQVTTQPNSTEDLGAKAAQPAEPWRIVRTDSAPETPFGRILSGHANANAVNKDESFNLHLIPVPAGDKIALWPEGEYGGDSVCFTIRSYVVARDDKNSDSVHPVGYSTCQPATRYRLKKAVMQAEPSDK
jgi:hypothetical protein